MVKKNKTIWAVIGSLLIILGAIGAIPLALNRILIGIVLTGIMVIIGVILIAWTLSD